MFPAPVKVLAAWLHLQMVQLILSKTGFHFFLNTERRKKSSFNVKVFRHFVKSTLAATSASNLRFLLSEISSGVSFILSPSHHPRLVTADGPAPP